MKTKIFIATLLFFLSCNLFSATIIKIKKLSNFSQKEKERVEFIVKNLEKVINSIEFNHYVKNYSVNGEFRYEWNNNQSNNEIYNKIMEGKEELSASIDYIWDLDLRLRWLFSSNTLAYTSSNTSQITINSRYFKGGADFSIAGTICHEYLHKLGYSHPREYSTVRDYSVPYAIGDICENIYLGSVESSFTSQLNRSSLTECGYFCSLARLFDEYFR
jgi:hypothetical protein